MTDTAAPRRRRWVMPLLLFSLAFNLLIIGIVAGTLISRGGERPDRVAREVGTLVGPHFFRALEPDDRRALVRDVLRQRDRVRENRTALRSRIERLLVLLRAETFDTGAARTLLEEQRDAVTARHQFGETLLLDRLSEMTTDERRAFAARLSASLETVRRD